MTRPFERHPTRPASGSIWQNWAGNVSAHPQQFLFPESEAELGQIVQERSVLFHPTQSVSFAIRSTGVLAPAC